MPTPADFLGEPCDWFGIELSARNRDFLLVPFFRAAFVIVPVGVAFSFLFFLLLFLQELFLAIFFFVRDFHTETSLGGEKNCGHLSVISSGWHVFASVSLIVALIARLRFSSVWRKDYCGKGGAACTSTLPNYKQKNILIEAHLRNWNSCYFLLRVRFLYFLFISQSLNLFLNRT